MSADSRKGGAGGAGLRHLESPGRRFVAVHCFDRGQ
jgi:hypothetical protein